MIVVRAQKKLVTSQGPLMLEVDFKIEAHQIVTLFGPSGVGKTTILRMIAGLTKPDEGRIEVDGDVWFDSSKRTDVPTQQRSMGFVFQDYNLFPNMTVRENLEFALKGKTDVGLIDDLLAMVDLTQMQGRKPMSLSGGQKQRVALVRALVHRPHVFLLDEPLSALDMPMRLKLQDDIHALYQRFQIPMICVTHDVSEVYKLAHEVLVLDNGKIIRRGKPQDVFGQSLLSGKFKFVGNIVSLEQDNFVSIVTVQIGNNLAKVVATFNEAAEWRVGDRVLVAAKAFNPIIQKI